MQSLDDTVFTYLTIEKENKVLQEKTGIRNLQEQNDNDNDLVSKERILEENGSSFEKYFEDSIIFPKNSEGCLSSTSNILRKNRNLSSQRDEISHKRNERDVSVINMKEHVSDITNVIEKSDEFNMQQLHNKESYNHVQHAISESNIMSSSINVLDDKENSDIILSRPLCTQDRYKLASWGLPSNILQKYIARGVSHMFEWQMECLSNHKVMQEKQNLVYSAPTSAGKTFIAEILLIKTVLERKKKVIFILPFVSVVREKMYYFQDLLSDSGIKVEGFMGGTVPPGGFNTTHVAIATIEKANSLVNRLMEENDLNSLGAVIIDELHLLGDANRGYLLELLLTKLKYMTIRNNNINIQLIGMSATLPNLILLAQWLNAELYKTDFRPIPLNEYCKIGTNIYDNKLNLVRKLATLPELKPDVDNILQLCIETISNGHSVLIFCPTKKWCEKLAEQIAATFSKLGCENTSLGEMLKKQINTTLIHETLEQLKRSPSGLDNILKSTISFGIAFHHAGLTMDERDIIEGSFRIGSLRVLIATSTLSSGVNLPARRVIIRSPLFANNLLNTLTYKQMIGRAGRMGKDSAGESILICKPNERNAAASLLSASLDPIESCLNDFMLLVRALLEAIASEVLYTSEDLELYINCTLLSLSEQCNVKVFSHEAIQFLMDNELLLLQTTEQESRWIATPLGKACLAASIPPREGLFLFEELQKARRCFVLDTELHVIYLVTPISSGSQIGTVDWMTFHELWNTISESERRVGQLVGVEERFVMSAIRGIIKSGKSLNIHKRFYSALALYDLVKEVPLNIVCKKYGCCRGVLQTLQQSAATYAGMVTQFCKQLKWDCMELLVSQFQTRLQFGVCRELLDLLRLPSLNGLRARSLYKQGITCIADLAVANELNVERALHNALPFESEKMHEGEYTLETEKRNKMRTVFVTGKDGLTPHQAAIMLVQEARMLVQKELGLEQFPWEQHDGSLQTDTSTENVETIWYMKEQLQTELDIKNFKYMKTVSTVKENSVNVESAINQKRKNLDLSMYKEVRKINAAKKKKTMDLNNQYLNQVVLSSKQSKNDVDPSNSLYINITDVTMNNEGLDNHKEKSKCSKIISNVKTKRNMKSPGKYNTNITNISNKKLKTSRPNEKENTNDNLIDKNVSIMNKVIISSDSSSPNLFDDSLNLDSQICDILEQNVINISQLEDTKIFACKSDAKNILQKRSANPNNNIVQICNEYHVKGTSTDALHLQSKDSVSSWGEDSWNNTEQLLKKVIEVKDRNIEERTYKYKIKNITNANTSIVAKDIKTYTRNKQEKLDNINPRKCTATAKAKRSHKPKLQTTALQSLVGNIIVFKNERKLSIDSNESDSDDIIVASQHVESPFNDIKNRTKTKLQQIRKIRSEKISEHTIKEINNTNFHTREISNDIVINKTKQSTKLKLKKDLVQPLITAGCCTDSIISNSEDDVATESRKLTFKIKEHETQSNILNKNVKSEKQILLQPDSKKDSLSETINWNTLNIVKVADNRATFNLFKREVLKKRMIALALHCDMYVDNRNNIGSKIYSSGIEGKRKTRSGNYTYANKEIRGAAISWENNIAYYISFNNSQESKISGKEQMTLLKELFSNTNLYMKCFDVKDMYKLLYQCCGISAECRFLDPIVAHWLYTNDTEKNFNEMVTQYFPQGNFIMKHINSYYNTGPGMDVRSSSSGEFRSAAETVLTWHMTDNIINKLEDVNPVLLHTFREIEMRTVIILACMELSGIGVNLKSLQELSSIILDEMQSLEIKAHSLAGRKFNLSSSKEVGQILGLYKDKKISTSKTVLKKCDNPISRLVILWRKLNATKTKIMYPLLNLAQQNSRIRGNCITCTVTGRISMHEPNLQNVPKDFSFEDNNFIISVRMAFIPTLGNIMLSVDYCQLELRLLTHFSQDAVLCEIMKQQGDIFKVIAAKWNIVTEEQVTDEMRQHTKQLCYGMIYGMGVKSLAENLCISESQAQQFLQSFMSTYPGIYNWLDDVLEEAHHNGYVETLFGRRRPLPDLKNTKSVMRAQAERQAINTKVQGSAADIVKKAMMNIEEKIRHYFPDSCVIFPEVNTARKLRSNSRDMQQRGGYLVLQLHDELLYEINQTDLKEVALIIKETMENVCQLTVPLPVKVRVGPAWGDLSDYQF